MGNILHTGKSITVNATIKADLYEKGIIFLPLQRVSPLYLSQIFISLTQKFIIMTTTSKVILSIIGAAAVGAAVGMLLAPDKGSELRKKVKETANDWAVQLADLFAEGKAELQKMKNKAASGAKDVRADAEDRVNNVRESFS
jgi:gas vesicle protein